MLMEKYYLVIVACGHVGAGKSIEVSRYFKDFDAVSAFISALHMPRCKKKPSSVKLIREITLEQYISGKSLEKNNPYLNTYSQIF